jgi:hypothetical protein
VKGESPWTILGVTPDAGADAVRAAYAALLKQTNPEDDAEGFQRLRQAYELALTHIRWGASKALAHNDELEDIAEQATAPTVSAAEIPSTAPKASSIEEPQKPPSEIETHAALCSVLYQALVSNAAREALLQSLNAVLTAPAMDRIDIFDRTAFWLVDLVHRTQPQSFALVDRIIQFYRWKSEREELGQWQGPRWMFELRAMILREAKIDAVVARLSDRRHEFNRAFQLTRADAKSMPERSSLERLWALRHLALLERYLAILKDRHAGALERLNQASLTWWNEQLEQTSLPYALLRNARSVLLGLVLFAALITAMLSVEP